MNTPIRKLLRAQETPLSGQLRKQFLNNLDLNMPIQGQRSRFSNGYEINSEVKTIYILLKFMILCFEFL